MCLNGGFWGLNSNEKSCSCTCPPGTRGDSCEHVTDGDYYHAVAPQHLSCSHVIRNAGLIELPLSNPSWDGRCVWMIQVRHEHSCPDMMERDFFFVQEKKYIQQSEFLKQELRAEKYATSHDEKFNILLFVTIYLLTSHKS
jgi:hypothetical protein